MCSVQGPGGYTTESRTPGSPTWWDDFQHAYARSDCEAVNTITEQLAGENITAHVHSYICRSDAPGSFGLTGWVDAAPVEKPACRHAMYLPLRGSACCAR